MTLTFFNARLIDPEAGTDTLGSVRVADGKIVEILPDDAQSIPAGPSVD